MIDGITDVNGRVASLLPETWALLRSSNLTVHPRVFRIPRHGSRGLAGGFRPDSDIDLTLLVDTVGLSENSDYDRLGCGLKCFEWESFDERSCENGGLDCFGFYKVQKGYPGFVEHAGVNVRKTNPLILV
jgi:hypothetical protein